MSEDNPDNQEPSMEEILASIRRIISEEDSEETAADATVEGDEDDDVFELTDEVDENGEPAVPPPELDPSFTGEPSEEEFERALGDIDTEENEGEDELLDVEEETVPELDAESAGMIEEEFLVEDGDPDDHPADSLPEPPASPPPQSPPQAPEEDEQLISPATASLTAAALAGLRPAAVESSMRLDGEKTLGALVRELLRPMMKEWLDDNLPTLVERIVREEIARVARTRNPE